MLALIDDVHEDVPIKGSLVIPTLTLGVPLNYQGDLSRTNSYANNNKWINSDAVAEQRVGKQGLNINL